MPGVIWILVNIVHTAPPRFLLPGGHTSISYYPYSFLHYSYADVVALYGARRLFLHTIPYFQNVIEYPVLIGLYMSIMSYLPTFWGYFIGSDFGLLAAFVLTLYPLWRARGAKVAWWLSLSPLLAVYSVLNWDLLGIMCWAWAIWTFEQKRYQRAGLWIGIGIAVKFFPIVMVPYFAAWLWQHHRTQLKPFLGGVALTGIGINLPFALFAENGWSEFFTYNSGRPPDPGIYQWLMQMGWLHLSGVNLVSALATVAGGVVLLWLMMRYQWNPVGVVAAALAWWLLCNKVYSPQYMLWVYAALLWVGADSWFLILLNFAGLLDFWLAMRWLGLGTTGSPFLGNFVRTFVAPVLSIRDSALLLAVAMAVLTTHRSAKSPP
ncbi:MAG: glycosyltransferase 87 family protein [Sulfobacillus sp.]